MSIAVLGLPAKVLVAGGCRGSFWEKRAGLGSVASCWMELFQAHSKMDLPVLKAELIFEFWILQDVQDLMES